LGLSFPAFELSAELMGQSVFNSVLLVQASSAALLFLVFHYLYAEARERYFRAWQISWGLLTVYSLCQLLIDHQNSRGGWVAYVLFLEKIALALVALCIYLSTRWVRQDFVRRKSDYVLLLVAFGWSAATAWSISKVPYGHLTEHPLLIYLEVDIGVGLLLAFSALRFFIEGRERASIPLRLIGFSLVFWAGLLIVGRVCSTLTSYPWLRDWFFSDYGKVSLLVPELLLAFAMMMALYENERRRMRESLLEFSRLHLDHRRLLDSAEIEDPMGKVLERILEVLRVSQGSTWIAPDWRRVLPTVQRGLPEDFLAVINQEGAAEFVAERAAACEGPWIKKRLDLLLAENSADTRAVRLCQMLKEKKHPGITVVSLRTQENNFGMVILPHADRAGLSGSQVRLLAGIARQLSLALENYVLMQQAIRRTQEYELLTDIGQVVSSRLDSDEVLGSIQRELGRLFDTRNFYIAFQEDEEIRFELEVVDGELLPKRSRRWTNGITEYIMESGEPLLVRCEMEKTRSNMGLIPTGRRSKCFCGVPIFMMGQPVGVMAALNYEREFVYEERDLNVMKTAAGQVAVAVSNARLFAEEQRRSRYLEFLNSVSRTAISTQEPEGMMADIVGEIEKNFHFDHIGIGILEYTRKEIEIKAEAGGAAGNVGRRIPLGVGILGRVARTSEMTLVQNAGEGRLLGILPESKSVLCIPIAYGDTLLGVLNVESRRENAFAQQEVLILRTLADLLATALHNAFVFKNMQQQSITDGLTGIKTRRFFNEALLSEWKRARRTKRPFSVVLLDLDKFKNVNDSKGHLEGDLVLARVGRILEQKSRQSNIVARYGGDEFVVLMPETSMEQAQILCERLRLWIATDIMLDERQITGSFGIATYPVHGSSAEDILHVADMGMYISKRAGGNRVSIYQDAAAAEALASKNPVSQYVELFLQRENVGPESVEELAETMQQLAFSLPDGNGVDALLEAINILNRAAEARDIATAGHGAAVAHYAEMIANEMALAEEEVMDVVRAAHIHDIGKVLVPESILNKAGKLTRDEFRQVQQHAVLGARIAELIPAGVRVAALVRHHHERFDGAGYPDKLKGEKIPLGARILAVAEAYVQQTSERTYAARKSPVYALTELETLTGAQYDPAVVRAFLHRMRTTKTATAEA
jgi:diguanylate cyclase (GGDEF)-like protein